VLAGLESFAQANQLPSSVVQAADLCLEEHITNVINYGYQDDKAHQILVRFTIENNSMVIEVEDDARPYNPLARGAVDTSVPLGEKPIGGLGIHLMRSFMDELNYRREANANILQMRKRLPS